MGFECHVAIDYFDNSWNSCSRQQSISTEDFAVNAANQSTNEHGESMNNDQDTGNTNSAANGTTGIAKRASGFASMDPARQREIASKGGKAAHQKGVAHQFTTETGRAAAMRKTNQTSGT